MVKEQPQYYTLQEAERMLSVYSHLKAKKHGGESILKIRPHNKEEDKYLITIFDVDQELTLAEYKRKYGLPFDFNAIHERRIE